MLEPWVRDKGTAYSWHNKQGENHVCISLVPHVPQIWCKGARQFSKAVHSTNILEKIVWGERMVGASVTRHATMQQTRELWPKHLLFFSTYTNIIINFFIHSSHSLFNEHSISLPETGLFVHCIPTKWNRSFYSKSVSQPNFHHNDVVFFWCYSFNLENLLTRISTDEILCFPQELKNILIIHFLSDSCDSDWTSVFVEFM